MTRDAVVSQKNGQKKNVYIFLGGDSQVVSLDQQVCIVKQDDLGPLHQQEECELDEQHQSQLADAADVQEYRAGQQGQQYAVAEILQQGEAEREEEEEEEWEG